jgi:hypothetical protein
MWCERCEQSEQSLSEHDHPSESHYQKAEFKNALHFCEGVAQVSFDVRYWR